MKKDKLFLLLPVRLLAFLIIFLAGSMITSRKLSDISASDHILMAYDISIGRSFFSGPAEHL